MWWCLRAIWSTVQAGKESDVFLTNSSAPSDNDESARFVYQQFPDQRSDDVRIVG
jgi:hypothetical protein